MTHSDVEAAHKHVSGHRDEVLASAWCGCFNCLATYEPHDVAEWRDDDQTAICPRCTAGKSTSFGTVLGDASGFPVEKQFLEAMREHWLES